MRLPEYKVLFRKSMSILFLTVLICLAAAGAWGGRPLASEAAPEESTESTGQQSDDGEVFLSDLTGVLSGEEMRQMRLGAQPLTEYADVYILCAPWDMDYKERYKKAYGVESFYNISGSSILLELYPDRQYASLSLYGMFSHGFIEFTDLDWISRARMEEDDYIGAVTELVPFLKAHLEKTYPMYENPKTYYQAAIVDFAGILSQQDQARLMDKMKKLTDYGCVLLSTGTLGDLADTDNLKSMSDPYVQMRLMNRPDLSIGVVNGYRAMDKESRIEIWMDEGSIQYDIEGSISNVLNYKRQLVMFEAGENTQQETDFPEGTRDDPEEPDSAAQSEAGELVGEGSDVRAADRLLDRLTGLVDFYESNLQDSETGVEGIAVPVQIKVPDITIMEGTRKATNDAGKEQLKKTMEKLLPWGKVAYITYSDGKLTPGEYLAERLGYFDFSFKDGLIYIRNGRTGEEKLLRYGKVARGLSSSTARQILEKTNTPAGVFEKVLEQLETDEKTWHMEAVCALMAALLLAFTTGVGLTFRGRFNQTGKAADAVNDGIPTIEDFDTWRGGW